MKSNPTGLFDFYGNLIKEGDVVEFHNDRERFEGTVFFLNGIFYVHINRNSRADLKTLCVMFVPIVININDRIKDIDEKLKELNSIMTKTRIEYQEIYKRKVDLIQEQSKKNIGQCFKNSKSTWYGIVLDVPQWEYRARVFEDSFNENEYNCLYIALSNCHEDDYENTIPEILVDKVNLYGINKNDKIFGPKGMYEKITREEFDSVLENNLKYFKKFIQESIDKNK